MPICPICNERPAVGVTYEESMCKKCQDEHDAIDWAAIAERRMEEGL